MLGMALHPAAAALLRRRLPRPEARLGRSSPRCRARLGGNTHSAASTVAVAAACRGVACAAAGPRLRLARLLRARCPVRVLRAWPVPV